MFSFRELVESMEEKTLESTVTTSRTPRLPLSGVSSDVPMNCKKSAQQQTSQYKIKTIDDKKEGRQMRERFWEYTKPQEDMEQQEGECWEEKVIQANRIGCQTASSSNMGTESLQVMQKEIDRLLTFKHGNLTPKYEQIFSINSRNAASGNDFTLPQKTSFVLDPAYQEPALGKQDLDYSSTSLWLQHQSTCSPQNFKYKRNRSFDQDSNAQASKCQPLKTNKRIVHHMTAKCKTPGRIYSTVKQKHSLDFSEYKIGGYEEVSNAISSDVRKLRSGDNFEDYYPQDLFFDETQKSSQYDETFCDGTPLKATVIFSNQSKWHKAAAKGSWGSGQSYTATDSVLNVAAAAVPLVIDNQNVNSHYHRNTPGYGLQTKDGHESISFRFRDHEEAQTSTDYRNTSKYSRKATGRITRPSLGELNNSELVSHTPTLPRTSGKSAKKVTTQLRRSSQRKMNKLKKKIIATEIAKKQQNYKMHEIKRSRRRETQGCVPAARNDNASIGNNEGPRSSSTLGFRCQLCPSWWRDETSLTRHQRLHAPARPFACPDCPSRFNQLVHLQIHRRTHTGEKPFRCDTCYASFSRKDRLRSHERRHSGEQPYICPYCPAFFRDAASLRGHVPAHAQQPPFTCRLCSATFAHLSTFTSHWRLHS